MVRSMRTREATSLVVLCAGWVCACWVDDVGRGAGSSPCERYLNYPVDLARKDLLNSGFVEGTQKAVRDLCAAPSGQFAAHPNDCGEPLDVTRYSCEQFWYKLYDTDGCGLIRRNGADTYCAVVIF